VVVAMRRQANVWQRVVLYTNGWGRMDTLGTVTNAQTTSYQPISCRRVSGRYVMVCSNGYVYVSNTGESWRGIGATNRGLRAADINTINGNIYATEYVEQNFVRILYTVDYINWITYRELSNTWSYFNPDWFFGYYCKTQDDGYTYISEDQYDNIIVRDSWDDYGDRNSAYCNVWKFGDNSPVLYNQNYWGYARLANSFPWYFLDYTNFHRTYCAAIANGKFVKYMHFYCNYYPNFFLYNYEYKPLYVDGTLVTMPSSNHVTDCVYIGGKYIVSTTGDEVFTTTDFSTYTLKISSNAKKMRVYGNIAYICTNGGLYTTTDGSTFTSQDNTKEYYDVAVA